jgi:hypothetical protein
MAYLDKQALFVGYGAFLGQFRIKNHSKLQHNSKSLSKGAGALLR